MTGCLDYILDNDESSSSSSSSSNNGNNNNGNNSSSNIGNSNNNIGNNRVRKNGMISDGSETDEQDVSTDEENNKKRRNNNDKNNNDDDDDDDESIYERRVLYLSPSQTSDNSISQSQSLSQKSSSDNSSAHNKVAINNKNGNNFGTLTASTTDDDLDLCRLSHGTSHPGLSTHEWEVRHTSPYYTFDSVKDRDTINKLWEWAVGLFLNCPLGDPIKHTQTLHDLLSQISSAEVSISATVPFVHIDPNNNDNNNNNNVKKNNKNKNNSKNNNQYPQNIELISIGVGEGIALNDLLLRCDRADVLCMVAAVIVHPTSQLSDIPFTGMEHYYIQLSVLSYFLVVPTSYLFILNRNIA